jgi:hypothetical protein
MEAAWRGEVERAKKDELKRDRVGNYSLELSFSLENSAKPLL